MLLPTAVAGIIFFLALRIAEWVRCLYENFGYTVRELLPCMHLLLVSVQRHMAESNKLKAIIAICGYPMVLPTSVPDLRALQLMDKAVSLEARLRSDGSSLSEAERAASLTLLRWQSG